jgi:5'-3' exonuclease
MTTERRVEVLVDFSNLWWRCATTMPPSLVWGPEFGVLRSLLALERRWPDCKLRIVHDGTCAWRSQVFPEYKQKDRMQVEDPFKAEMYRKRDAFKQVLAWIMPQYDSEGSEADDVIAALRVMFDPATCPTTGNVYIYSPDKDFLQLVDDDVSIMKPTLGASVEAVAEVTKSDVMKEWNIDHPFALRWVRAYTGCGTDGVPGSSVPVKFLGQLCSQLPFPAGWNVDVEAELATIEARAKNFKAPGWGPGRLTQLLSFHSDAIRNYKVMTLLPPRISTIIRCDYRPDSERFLDYIRQAEMRSIIGTIERVWCQPELHTDFERDMTHEWQTHYQRIAEDLSRDRAEQI